MKTLFAALAILALSASTYAADNAKRPVGDTVFREPFTLTLHIDKERPADAAVVRWLDISTNIDYINQN